MKSITRTATFWSLLSLFFLLPMYEVRAEGRSPNATTNNVSGWRAARWGMTEDEVLAAFPNEVKRLEKPEKFSRAIATLGIEKLKVSGDDFVVRFLFDTETKRLKQVNLKPDPSKRSLDLIFPTLERDLTEKYGKPDFTSDQSPAIQGAKEMRRSWKKGETRIELLYFHDPGIKTELLVITYQAVSDSGEKNL